MPRSRASAHYTIRAEDKTRAGTSSARRNFDALAVTVGRVGVVAAAAGIAAVGASAEIIRRNAGVIDSYGKLSEKLGISVSSYQAINDAADRAGIAQNTLNTSLQRGLRRTSEAAAGTGEAVKAFDELGLSAKELQQLSPEDRIYAILDALQQLGDEGDRVRLAAKIFDSEGVDLVRLFTGEITGAKNELAELGLTLTEIDVAAVEAMNDEIQRVQRNALAASQVFTGEMAPAIQAVASVAGDIGVSLLGSREAAEVFADALITGVGSAGEVINLVRKGVIGLAAASAEASLALIELADRIPGIDLTEQAENAQLAADKLVGAYGAIPDVGEFVGGLREVLEANRVAAEQAAADIEANRRRAREPFAVRVGIEVEGGADSISETVDKVQADVARDFDTLLNTLRDSSSSYEAEFRARIEAADRLRTEFPELAGQALQAEVAAIEERNAVLASIGRGSVDLGVTVTGAAGDLAATIGADTADLQSALAARNAVLAAPAPTVPAPDVVASDDAINTIRAANDSFIQAAAERDDAIAAISSQRVDVGVDLRDGASVAADGLQAGTARLADESESRASVLDEIRSATVVAGVSLEDEANAAADDLRDGTSRIVSAAEDRPDALINDSSSRIALSVALEDDATIAASAIADNTATLRDELDRRGDALTGTNTARVTAGVELQDDTGEAIAELDASRQAFESAVQRRVRDFDALGEPRVVAGIHLTDEAVIAADAIRDGTADVLEAAAARPALLEQFANARASLGVVVEDGAAQAADDIEDGTALLEAARRRRGVVFGELSTSTVRAAIDLTDEVALAIADLDDGTEQFEAALARRVRGFESLASPRVVAGIDLRDEADQAADVLADGSRRLVIETRARGEIVESLDGSSTVNVDVTLNDGAPAAIDAIDASTQALVEARERRERLLGALATAANDADFGVEIDFDIQFPEFSTATSKASRQLEDDLATIAGYRQQFPNEIDKLAEAEALAYARRDQAIAEAISASNDAIADLQAPIQQDVSALEQSLQSEVQAIEAQYVKRAAVIRDGIAFEVLAEEEGTALLVAAKQKRLDDLKALDEARAADEARQRQQLIGDASTVFGSILALQEEEVGSFIQINERMSAEERKRAQESNRRNRERFEDNKRYQTGQAFINMLAGISQVIADPTLSYYEKIGASAATAAQGAVLISRIKSAEFGGGGTAPNVSGAAGAGGTPDTRLADSVELPQQSQDSSNNRPIIIVSGDSNMTDEQIEAAWLRGEELGRRSGRIRYSGDGPATTQFDIERVA